MALERHTPGIPAEIIKVLSSNATGSNSNSAQPWFPSSGGVTLEGSTTYRVKGVLHISRSAGTTSHSTGLSFGGTATLTSMRIRVSCNTGDATTTATQSSTLLTSASNTSVKAASTSATEQIHLEIEGIVRVNAGGTFIPQFTYSAAPGGSPSIQADSFIEFSRIGSNTVTEKGSWS